MIKLSQEQFEQFTRLEEEEYINKIAQEIIAKYPEVENEQGSLAVRLNETYKYLITLQFRKESLIKSFLYLVAFNPSFHRDEIIRDMLEKEGRNPEQQYEDLLLIIKNRQGRRS